MDWTANGPLSDDSEQRNIATKRQNRRDGTPSHRSQFVGPGHLRQPEIERMFGLQHFAGDRTFTKSLTKQLLQLVQLGLQPRIGGQMRFDLADRVQHGGVIAATEAATDFG